MTNQLKSISLNEFEELAKKFIEEQNNRNFDTITSDKIQSEKWIEKFKQFVFIVQPSRKEAYFKLKEQLEKLKDEFEPDCVDGDSTNNYKKQYEVEGCEGCAFLKDNGGCSQQKGLPYTCSIENHIWIKVE